jgi:hypothetical protein
MPPLMPDNLPHFINIQKKGIKRSSTPHHPLKLLITFSLKTVDGTNLKNSSRHPDTFPRVWLMIKEMGIPE